jgi:hypothetical protein
MVSIAYNNNIPVVVGCQHHPTTPLMAAMLLLNELGQSQFRADAVGGKAADLW